MRCQGAVNLSLTWAPLALGGRLRWMASGLVESDPMLIMRPILAHV